jgi:cellulose synthase/poly-beta-1,6-N-acetylglucosamine synthase-like glycosyltransferase
MSLNRLMIGICAYNEENNIARLLQNLISEQNIPKESEILVVCSGCTDGTPQIVESFQKKDSRIKPIIENVRKGKSSALNKIFKVARAEADILVLVNADALPKKGSINKLVSKFTTPDVGAVFAQPVPLKNSDDSCYGVTRLIWRLHHIISILDTPKLSGELCAIRTACLQEIPENIATDEPYIEGTIQKRHKNTLYAPEALVYIRCPTNIVDIIEQRKRIWIGHMQLQNTTGYKVSTSSFKNMLRAVFELKRDETIYVLPGGFLEIVAYLEARILFSKGTIPYVWEPIKSTKASM